MTLVAVVLRDLTRSVLSDEREIDRKFDWFDATQEYDDIMNNIILSSVRKNQMYLLVVTTLSNLLFSIKNNKQLQITWLTNSIELCVPMELTNPQSSMKLGI